MYANSSLAAANSSQPLLSVCICFAVLQAFFLVAFLISWKLSRSIHNRSNTVFSFILFGYVCCFGGIVVGVLRTTKGDVGTTQLILQLFKAHEFIYAISIFIPKLALLYLYRNMFTSLAMKLLIYVAVIIVITTFILGLTVAVINCRPFSATWNLNLEAKCTIDSVTVFRCYSILNIVSGVILVTLPVPALRKVQANNMTKTGLCLSLLLLSLGIIAAALRLVSFSNVNGFRDTTRVIVPNLSVSVIETGVYLLAATIPTLRSLVESFSGREDHSCTKIQLRMSGPFQPLDFNSLEPKISLPVRIHRKKSSQSLCLQLAETVGRRISKIIPLEDYADMQKHSLIGSRSVDEESLVCADAVAQERYAKEGRNPDGTLRTWSLMPPARLSPLRASFFLEEPAKSAETKI